MASDKATLTPSESDATSIPTLRIVKSADYRLHYCNHARIGLSAYDVRFHVGHQLDVAMDPGGVEESAMVVMSPVQAKTVVLMLARAVAQYEKAFGTIQAAPVSDAEGNPLGDPGPSEKPKESSAPSASTQGRRARPK